MSWNKLIIFGCMAIFAKIALADIMVQLNTNRPINDVSDKFISFTMKPEDLYEALDGSNRKSVTRMASMLSDAHVKFLGDYYFATQKETNLRNPTKIVWKGFNKWTKAIKWSMVIPVPYSPNNWDPMETLKILNNSQSVGITDCIWQLGTDFGSSAALDYVTELKTFNIMVDSFRRSLNNWQIMGADISSGSCPDETRRYIEMTRGLNAAYGWTESADMLMGNSLTSALTEQDPALKVLLKEKVPVWLTLPKSQSTKMSLVGEIYDGLDWAQTMGDAANTGFNTIFKHISLSDWETPKYDFFVTALFKKIMGARVFPARPLGFFGRNNKLYTHCANDVSGGLAFMVVNKQDTPMQIAIRSTSKMQDTEVWQYALTMNNGQIKLNNKRINENLNLQPEIKRKQPKSMLQLKAPALSVSFWVLPNVEMQHCQYTEVDASEEEDNEEEEEEEVFSPKNKRYSPTDRLLKELMKDAATSRSSSGRKVYRQRRSIDNNERLKRFVLENGLNDKDSNFDSEEPFKRDLFSPERRKAAMAWLSQFMRHENANMDIPLLRRNIRDSDSYMGPFFMTRDGKKISFAKKSTETKKPEKKLKQLYEDLEFDEEKFFKNVGVPKEPDYIKVPEGDVILQNIAPNGNNAPAEEMKIERVKETKMEQKSKTKKEIVNEMKPLRLLPTEFYEALPGFPKNPLANKLNLGNAFNSFLFPDSFGKTFGQHNANLFDKNNYDLKEDSNTNSIEEPENSTNEETTATADTGSDDFLKAQLNVREKIYQKKSQGNEEKKTKDLKEDSEEDPEPLKDSNKKKYFEDLLKDKKYNFFGDITNAKSNDEEENEDEKISTPEEKSTSNTKQKFEELPWWELPPMRSKRSADIRYSGKSWHHNLITKNEDPIVAANEISPRRLRAFEYKIDEAVRSTQTRGENDDDSIGKKIVDTLKNQVTKLVDMVSHQVNEWYNSLTNQLDSSNIENKV